MTFASKVGSNWATINRTRSNLVDFGPSWADIGPLSVEITLTCRFRAKAGRPPPPPDLSTTRLPLPMQVYRKIFSGKCTAATLEP